MDELFWVYWTFKAESQHLHPKVIVSSKIQSARAEVPSRLAVDRHQAGEHLLLGQEEIIWLSKKDE